MTAPASVEPGRQDIMATAEGVYTVEVLHVLTDGPVVPVLARRVELTIAAT